MYARATRTQRAFAVRVDARCTCSGPTDSPPMASDTSTHPCMLTCKRVLQCESTCVAGEARTRAACVTSVLSTRVVVYRAQRGERGIGGDEDEAVANPGAHISECREIGKSGNREIGNASRAYGDRKRDHAAARPRCCRRRARRLARPAVRLQCKRSKYTRRPQYARRNLM